MFHKLALHRNAAAERFVGSCRRVPLEHVIVLKERHLKRPMNEYFSYYHDNRIHLGLNKQTPVRCEAAKGDSASRIVVCMPRLGGLHHRYDIAI